MALSWHIRSGSGVRVWSDGGLVDDVADRLGDDDVAVSGGVRVDEGRPRGRVAHPGHELLGGRARRRGEGVPGGAEVVEVRVRKLGQSIGFGTVEVRQLTGV